MKTKAYLTVLFLALLLSSCVQKSYEQTVVVLLDVSALKDVKFVGVRGNDKPFSWDNDAEMQMIKKDSLYKTTVTIKTGYLFTEIKFTVNGDFELKEKENRRIYFDKSITTTYKATFYKLK